MILVPTIMNNASKNALKYAVEVSKVFNNLGIVCFHATESDSSVEEISAIRKGIQNDVDRVKGDGSMEIVIKIVNDEFEPGIMNFAAHNLVDVIIVGTRKVQGFQKVMHEGRTSKFLNNTNLPTWIIPEDYTFKPIENIMWASDFKPMKNDDALDPVVAIAGAFDAEVRIAHVHTNKDKLDIIEQNEMNRQDFLFSKGVKHSFKKIKRSTVNKGIAHYLNVKGDNDLLVFVKRNKGFLDKLFRKENSIDFTVNPRLPIMIVHEEAEKGPLRRNYKN